MSMKYIKRMIGINDCPTDKDNTKDDYKVEDKGNNKDKVKKPIDVIYDVVYRFCLLILAGMLLVAVYACTRIYIADNFRIPTGSMEPTLIPGDNVIVNKLIAGARIYDEFDFTDGVPMKSHRAWGYRQVEHNDIVIFNFPINRSKYKMEFKINYVYGKRCIACPGDSVSIRNGYFHNNRYSGVLGNISRQDILSATPDSLLPRNVLYAMPFDPVNYGWTIKNFGPLYVPEIGGKVVLDQTNYRLYKLAVEFETGKRLYINKSGVLMLGDDVAGEYVFRKNYYFMCGDNVMDSNDSRYWGFVPEEFIVGVVSRIIFSRDKYSDEFRWDRFLKSVLKSVLKD